MTLQVLLAQLATAFADVEHTGSRFSEEAFYKRPDTGQWSAAENMQHLFLSVRPLVGLFGKPELMEPFGRRSRPSMNYDEVVALYQERLKDFAASGIVNTADGLNPIQAAQIETMHSIHAKFLERAATLPDTILDDYQIPHPLLGMLTPREFIYFTHCHTLHHMHTMEGLL